MDFQDGCGHGQAISLELGVWEQGHAISSEEHGPARLQRTVRGDELAPFRHKGRFCMAGPGAADSHSTKGGPDVLLRLLGHQTST